MNFYLWGHWVYFLAFCSRIIPRGTSPKKVVVVLCVNNKLWWFGGSTSTKWFQFVYLIPGRIGILFGNAGFWREKTGVPREKLLGAKERTNSKLNPHLSSTPGFERGPHWWEASVLTTASSLASHPVLLCLTQLYSRSCPIYPWILPYERCVNSLFPWCPGAVGVWKMSFS